jgi:hypothetical protein
MKKASLMACAQYIKQVTKYSDVDHKKNLDFTMEDNQQGEQRKDK